MVSVEVPVLRKGNEKHTMEQSTIDHGLAFPGPQRYCSNGGSSLQIMKQKAANIQRKTLNALNVTKLGELLSKTT